MSHEVTAFAPATVSNLSVGFDVLGLALSGPGDTVTARLTDATGVRIASVSSSVPGSPPLPTDPNRNTAAIAAAHTLKRAGIQAGVELDIVKGLPIGSGLGSSAASAAAAAFAVNLLLGSPLRRAELIEPVLEAEATVAGRHADNAAPAILGGLVLVRSLDPLDVVRVPVPENLWVAVASPRFELLTRQSRAALPREVPLSEMVKMTAGIAALISACHSGDLGLLARALSEGDPVTRARVGLIPGGASVISSALEAGAIASSISGSGPSIFALCRSRFDAEASAAAMKSAFASAGLECATHLSSADAPGARRV
ncbi:MAG: homoserine kinase [Phycisphaerales bacterium]